MTLVQAWALRVKMEGRLLLEMTSAEWDVFNASGWVNDLADMGYKIILDDNEYEIVRGRA